MSFNVRNMRANDGENGWDFRRGLVFDVIRRYNPDILATQEAYHEQVEDLCDALPQYVQTGAGRDDGAREGEYCALFYRRDRFAADRQETFWFSETPSVPGSRHWTRHHARICTSVRLSASGESITIYNVHLDHESQDARERSARMLRGRVDGHVPPEHIVVAGDFNMEEGNPAIGRLLAGTPPLADTFRVKHPHQNACGSFHGFTGRTDGERIDFIFASAEFTVAEASILHDNDSGRYPSDHFPILARLRT